MRFAILFCSRSFTKKFSTGFGTGQGIFSGSDTKKSSVWLNCARKFCGDSTLGKMEKVEGCETNGLASSKRSLAPWQLPATSGDKRHRLVLYNSLTRSKELFIPEQGNRVSWYICGPTVYDSAHMGHARSYISFDILRRVMQNYFGYDVLFVMNITDVDDKIIKRARQKYLLDRYLSNGLHIQKVIDDVLAAMLIFKERHENEPNSEKKVMLENLLAKVDKSVTELEISLRSQKVDGVELWKKRLLEDARDVLAEWLDSQLGASVTDRSIFESLARHFEADFYSDMAELNVLPPDVVTRVSEYVPEITKFIEKIIENGYAYESNGSVYFDTLAFDKHPKHHYAKLVPESFNDHDSQMSNAMREGEGELTDVKQTDKHSCNDFALWKASKAGEPSWPSPWGSGRPGWHIECSVMATAICGPKLDVHGGGFDLKFPHHDNELAQTEAHYKHDQWVNYFLHAGTLKIAGLKMSKSLKNFITIKEALKQYTSRQLRLLFLLHNWSDVLDYSPTTMEMALRFEKVCTEFFMCVKFYVRERYNRNLASTFAKFELDESELNDKFAQFKQMVDQALCDSVDTRAALETIRELISATNVYVNKKNAQKGKQPNIVLVRNVALYVSKMLKVFGVNASDDDEIGFGAGGDNHLTSESCVSNGQSNLVDKEELLMPYVKALANFREKVRQVAIESKIGSILTECDKVRNEILPALGVRLEDREDHTMVKFCDPEELLREKKQELEQREKLLLEKERKKAELATRQSRRRLPPDQMFRLGDEAAKFSQFDAKGIPTHDDKGVELSKGVRKKLEKAHAAHETRYKETSEAPKNGVAVDRNGVET